ncbi:MULTISPECIES: hypothetical protein [unclassified Streptomyces]|uniref:hypothetical protein n=1 Tax=unclassified Streptomyces TaxID=2593676 RepID=UPI001F0458B3|nr:MULTISPECIES: hypothetical protein [unclassified Streptomyces]MCH0564664.1 hypothetical protein [Streptomyces sp. MUM 2J]MCH0570364.1 hypothetical protein [Streptomyces sp. MUM 136J]
MRGRGTGREPVPGPDSFPRRPYDLVKEFTIALAAAVVLTVGLAALFSSPDESPITLARWARSAPDDFAATAVAELAATSGTAQYGPPYTSTPGAEQKIGPVSLQRAAGVTIPINTARDFVLRPLTAAPEPASVSDGLATWRDAPAGRRRQWATAYAEALDRAGGDPADVPPGDYGPVPVLTSRLLELAQAGALDGELLAAGHFYQTDYTRPLLFLGDGSYLEDQARARHLAGDQWGMMNETGNYPGQPWLWLYTLWYQIEPFSSSGNADALVWGLMALLTLVFILVPFIPGIRSIPRWSRVHRLVWRDYYRSRRTARRH